MSFLFGGGQAAAPPPPPPTLAASSIAIQAADARNSAAAAAGKMGFGRTVKTSAQGAPTPDTTTTDLKPQAPAASVFGG